VLRRVLIHPHRNLAPFLHTGISGIASTVPRMR
jgi:hypothetical protein